MIHFVRLPAALIGVFVLLCTGALLVGAEQSAWVVRHIRLSYNSEWNLYAVDVDRRLTVEPWRVDISDRRTNIAFPLPSPDGRYLAFGYKWPLGGIPLYDMQANTLIDEFPGDWALGVAWSPDGRALLMQNIREVLQKATINDDGSTNSVQTLYATNGNRVIYNPQWSPDGSQIVFITHSTSAGKPRLHLIDADGGNERILVDEVMDDYGVPQWSPDSTQIVFTATNHDTDGLHLVATDDGDLRTIGESVHLYIRPAWSPDGSRIAFSGFYGGDDGLYALGMDREIAPMPLGVAVRTGLPIWSPPVVWSSDGSRIAFRHPGGEIFVKRTHGGEAFTITNNEQSFLLP